MAINQIMSEAAEKGENINFFEIVKRAYHRKNDLETKFSEQQKALANDSPAK